MSGKIEHFWRIFHTNDVIFCSFYKLKLYFWRIRLIIIQSLQAIQIINDAIIDTWESIFNVWSNWIFFTPMKWFFCSFYLLKLDFWRIWLIIIQSLKAIWIINYAIIDTWREFLMYGQNEPFWGHFPHLKIDQSGQLNYQKRIYLLWRPVIQSLLS